VNEETIIRTMPLPHGQLWALHCDANVIVLSPCLDAAGREAAITELQAQWRRSALRVVDEAPNVAAEARTTVPMKRLPAALVTAEG